MSVVDNRLVDHYISGDMQSTRPSRFLSTLVALFGMLFMQLAVASYACPDLNLAQERQELSATIDMAMQEMASCTGKDLAQPNLCHAHSHAGEQSLDKPQTPSAQSFVAVGLASPFYPAGLAHRGTTVPSDIPRLSHATAPPMAIRNCCFRI